MIYQYLSSQNLWREDKFKWSSFSGFEIWCSTSSEYQKTEDQLLKEENLDVWLNRAPQKRDCDGNEWIRSYQMIIASDCGNALPQLSPRKCLSAILDHSQLQLAFDYAMSSPAGISALPSQATSRDEIRTYILANHPKLACIWKHVMPRASACGNTTHQDEGLASHERLAKPASHTFGIIFVDSKGSENLQRIFEYQWPINVVSHPMFPAFISSLHLNFRIDMIHQHIKKEIRHVEARTGHHCFNTRQCPALGDLRELSAYMSGFTTKLAGTTRKMEFLHEIYRFIYSQTDTNYGCGKRSFAEGGKCTRCVEMGHQVKLMQNRLKMQHLENNFIRTRVNVQMNAIFHLTAQHSSTNGIQIAVATQATAMVSLRESSFMKILTLMAVTFLPGNFVAALFSTSIFDRESAVSTTMIEIVNKPLFTLFWIITIPLTLFIYIIVVACVFLQNRHTYKKIRDAQDQLANKSK